MEKSMFFSIFLPKNLHNSKKSSTFAVQFGNELSAISRQVSEIGMLKTES